VIDGGLLLMLLGALGMGIVPIEAALAHRRWVKSLQHAAPWLKAIPIVPPDSELDRIIEQLDR
jgi:hypothetical protein